MGQGDAESSETSDVAGGKARNTVAFAAAAVAFLSAAVSMYWTFGGTAMLDTVGGSLERAARQRRASAVALGLVTVALKLIGAALALALVEPWRHRRGRLLARIGTVLGVLLVLYGAVSIVGAALGLAGVVGNGEVDRRALWGHALLWDPWFVVWGALWWRATHAAQRTGGSPRMTRRGGGA